MTSFNPQDRDSLESEFASIHQDKSDITPYFTEDKIHNPQNVQDTTSFAPARKPLAVYARNIRKAFGRFPALENVDLEIRPGEITALLGPSGSGKTTLLRVIAGLEFPDSGEILFDSEDVTLKAAAARGVGFVFQQYALFRHMTVADNIAYGLDVRPRALRPSKQERADRVETLLNLVELDGLGQRHPNQLSGGQRQRVALARALAVDPKILLLDEPFGALDATVRKSLRRELRRVHDATGVTTLIVTHDQDEALELADRVAVMRSGHVIQLGTPSDIYDNPASAFVAGFVGNSNRFSGDVINGVFHNQDISFSVSGPKDGKALAFIRPHHFVLASDSEKDAALRGLLRRIILEGPIIRLEWESKTGRILEAVIGHSEMSLLPEPGQALWFKIKRGHVFALA